MTGFADRARRSLGWAVLALPIAWVNVGRAQTPDTMRVVTPPAPAAAPTSALSAAAALTSALSAAAAPTSALFAVAAPSSAASPVTAPISATVAPPRWSWPSPGLFGPREWRLSAAFAGATAAMMPFDERIARYSQTPAIQGKAGYTHAANFFNTAGSPGVLYGSVGLYAAGRLTSHRRVAELGLRAAEAIVVSGWATGGAKGIVGRARPYIVGDSQPANLQIWRGLLHGEHYQSFPSGHATAAFAFASVMAGEAAAWWPRSRWWTGILFYGGATAVGLARIHDDRHWASDVMAGAGVGTLSGVMVLRFHHARPNTRWDRWMLPSVSLGP